MCQSCGPNEATGRHDDAEQAARASLRIRHYHLILADIAVAAAVRSLGHAELPAAGRSYVPGAIRDLWQAAAPDDAALRRVNALASAGLGALQGQSGEAIAAAARRYGVPLEADLAQDIAEHFSDRRGAIMTYDR